MSTAPVVRTYGGMPPPPDTRSQREPIPRECEEEVYVADDDNKLMCWRLKDHPGHHYDQVDEVFWTLDPVGEPVPIR